MQLRADEITVYLTSHSNDNFIGSVRDANDNDIIIHYNREKDLLTKIAGKRGNTSHLANEIMRLRHDNLRSLFSDTLGISRLKRQGAYYRLRVGDWRKLRRAIINAAPELETVIEKLEEIQLRQPLLRANAAVIYDTLHSIIEIYNPTGIRSLNQLLDDWRNHVSSDDDISSDPSELIPSLGERIKTHPAVQNYQSIDDLIREAYKNNLNEVDAVQFDAETGLPGTERDLTQPIHERVFNFQFVDTENPQRKLTVWMAHQRASNRSDLLGSDLYYEHHTNRSVVFIQHKRLPKNSQNWVLRTDDNQLSQLIGTCQLQGICHNQAHTETIFPSTHMRLYDCPVFYKVLDHDVKIKEGSRSSSGIYIQACRAKALMREENGSVNKDIIRDNGMYLETFSELLRRAQLGSKATAFIDLKRRILAHLTGEDVSERLVTVASERYGSL